ncbi:MAG: glycosyltransferase family 39 protein [Nitrospirae bacterium]|nr:glycosyltransferase family 39 protein [Nitrospirota bacterium]
MKLKEIINWLTICALYLTVLLIVAYWSDSYTEYALKGQLIRVIPYFLKINFFLLVVSLALNCKTLKDLLAGLGIKKGILLVVVVLAGFAMSMFLAPRTHRIFYDETIYMNVGQNIAFLDKAGMCNDGYFDHKKYACSEMEFNKQPYAYPFLVGLVFKVFGTSETAGFVLNNVIYALSVFIAFMIGYLLFGNFYPAFFSSVIFALIPDNLMWSNATSAELSASCFIGLAICSALLFVRNKDLKSLFLFSVIVPFSVQFRMESMLVVPLVIFAIALEDRKAFTKKSLYLFGALAFALVVAHLVHIYAVRGDSWGSSGPRMDFSYLKNNLRTNTFYYIDNRMFPRFYTVLAFLGLFFRKDLLKGRAFLAVWFLCLWGIYMFFYAGSYGYGADVRYSLMSFMPLSLLAGLGLYRAGTLFEHKKARIVCGTLAAAVAVWSFIHFIPAIRIIGEEACQARADHFYVQKMAAMLPDNSIVLTHNPNMFLLLGKNAAQAGAAYYDFRKMKSYYDRYKGGVYFHFNFWCNVDDPVQKSFCASMLDKYSHTKIAAWRDRSYDFILYKLEQSALQ